MNPARPLLANRYAIHQPLDCGTGSVRFLATDTTSTELVVVALLDKDEARWRSAAHKVTHRHLATVIDVISQVDVEALPPSTVVPPEAQAVVAELIRGRTLDSLLASGPLGLDRAVAWFIRLGDALRALHTRQAAHGALSSDAVIVQPRGRAIAPVLSQLVIPPNLHYASPERLRGEGPSVADDLWALGVLLFESLTGGLPFSGRTPAEIVKGSSGALMATGVEAQPHGRELDVIVRRLLEPDRRRRFASAEEVVELLDRWERRMALPTVVPVVTRPTLHNAQVPKPAAWDPLVIDRPSGFATMSGALDAAEAQRIQYLAKRPTVAGSGAGAGEDAADATVTPTDEAATERATPTNGGKKRGISISPDAFSARLRGRSHRTWILGVVGGIALLAGGVGFGKYFRGEAEVAVGPNRVSATAGEPTAASRAAAKPAAPEDQTRCIRSYFLRDTFRTSPDLDFVCAEDEFLSATRRLHELANLEQVPAAGDGGAPPPGSAAVASPAPATSPRPGSTGLVITPSVTPRTWQLGWYELVATGIIRQNCCKELRPIRLPEVGGVCPKLPGVISRIAIDSTKSGDLSPGIRAFDEGIICLLDQGRFSAYPYKAAPSGGHKAALQQFLKNAAETDARRASGRY